MSSGDLIVVCPCCETKLVVDRITGALVSHEAAPKGPAKTFDEAVGEEKKRRQEAEDRFAQAFNEHEHREEILDKKFQEALKRAEKEGADKPPPHPFDFD